MGHILFLWLLYSIFFPTAILYDSQRVGRLEEVTLKVKKAQDLHCHYKVILLFYFLWQSLDVAIFSLTIQ